jgi:DnaJ family protein C protein 7
VLMVRAEVDMAAGRLEEAVVTAQTACQLDSGSQEAAAVHRRTKAVASERLRGNDLFRASRFTKPTARASSVALGRSAALCSSATVTRSTPS